MIFQPLESKVSRAELGRRLRDPRLEWDSLSRMRIPVCLRSEREPGESAGRDVMLSGPWSFRGTPFELRESDRHERLRRAVLAALGFYDWHERPAFDAPAYELRRERARQILALGFVGASVANSAFAAPPVALPWHCTSADDCYDARYEVTGSSPVTALGDQGTRNLDASNGSSTLTLTSAWSGALDAVTATGAATDRLTCAGTASQWRLHSGNAWSSVMVGQATSVAASRAFLGNRADPSSSGALGMGYCFRSGTGYRYQTGNGAANVYSLADEALLADAYVGKFVWGVRIGGGNAVQAMRIPSNYSTGTTAQSNTPSDTDAGVMSLGAGTAGAIPLVGHLAHATFYQLNSAGWLQSLVDHMRALARL